MSAAKQTKTETREEIQVRLQKKRKAISSAPMLLPKDHLAKVMKPSPSGKKQTLDKQYHWNNKTSRVIAKEWRGKHYINYVQADDRKHPVTLSAMTVKKSCLGEDGTLGVVYNDFVQKVPHDAYYELVLSTGIPSHMDEWAVKNNKEKEQNDCFNFVKNIANDMVQEGIDSNIWEHAIGEQDPKEWAASGHSYIDRDGENTFTLKRKVQPQWGDLPSMRYWRKTRAGDYEQYYPAEIPVGALVIAQFTPKAYCFDKGGEYVHGSSFDLERDLIVIWSPPARTKEEIQAETKRFEEEQGLKRKEDEQAAVKAGLEDVPFIEF